MKTVLIFFGLVIITKSAVGQNSVYGCYGRQDSQIKINNDSTFFYFYAVDTYRGWLKGIWKLKGRKIQLTPKLVYDTIAVNKNNLKYDSLVLSRDYTSERIDKINNKAKYVFQYEQNEKLCPKLLRYKGDILYIIINRKRQTKKIQNGYYIKPFNPWFIKNQCKY